MIYNLHPARIFMGDVGSLGLGGALAAAAILTKAEFSLAVIGGLYVLEALSVILQVLSFQLTGRRILLMAPLHHHFELKGWGRVAGGNRFLGAGLYLCPHRAPGVAVAMRMGVVSF